MARATVASVLRYADPHSQSTTMCTLLMLWSRPPPHGWIWPAGSVAFGSSATEHLVQRVAQQRQVLAFDDADVAVVAPADPEVRPFRRVHEHRVAAIRGDRDLRVRPTLVSHSVPLWCG